MALFVQAVDARAQLFTDRRKQQEAGSLAGAAGNRP
jgi:hypothetical protein